MNEFIEIKNARIHNLKNIDVKIPRGKLTVITGVSGSGKSSLAFDTLYEEGKRRYLLFSGAQFIVDSAPSFDQITGLSPAVAARQSVIRQSNPRSTVGTRTKISNMLAMLFAVYGEREGGYADSQPLSMEMFQKNSPKGMCVKCLGAGVVKELNEVKLFEDLSQKIEDVSLGVGKRGSTRRMLDVFYKYYNIKPTQQLSELTSEQLNSLKYGDGKSQFMGFIPWITRVTNGVFASSGRLEYLLAKAGLMARRACPKCGGAGLGEQASHTVFMGKTIAELEDMYITDLRLLLGTPSLSQNPLIKDIVIKLDCMAGVGLSHLALSRKVPTLSGGEIQRLFLAAYIIAEMDGVIFIFDEPTVGLHESEKAQLIEILKNLAERGNTVIAVEHDENFMKQADYIVDLGPGAGVSGGESVYQGSYEGLLKCKNSNTAPYLRDKDIFGIKHSYGAINPQNMLRIENAGLNNLKNITVEIPLGLMVGIAGVSGSGKSSLAFHTLVPELKGILKSKCVTGDNEEDGDGTDEIEAISNESGFCTLHGAQGIKKCLVIDQRPIGRSRTSCPATYTGMFDRIRALFAARNNLPAGMFTVNSQGGCKLCKGDGEVHYHVGYGNFINLECDACGGTGFIKEAIEAKLNGKNIKEILSMTVDEALGFFSGMDRPVESMLKTLKRVGMGYITLGQKTPTLSGGESQRIKLAKELSAGRGSKDALYILDEPTTGLSYHDSRKLVDLLKELVENGGSVIVTEHDPYVLSNCDYLIEMGKGGGSNGGSIIAAGTPCELKANPNSIIRRYLK